VLVLLTLLSAVVAVLFLGILIFYLNKIMGTLYAIGYKPDSYLAKLRLGLNAIEGETAHLPGQVTQLNQTLDTIAGGLQQADDHLVGTIDAVVKQEGAAS
jgi:hypothetical protein